MSRPNPRTFLAAAVHAAAAAFATPSLAAESSLDEVTVTATKMPMPIIEVPAAVTVRTDRDIDREVATDIKDLVRYEPGVSVRNAAGRFGLEGFTIRGLDGNRVAIEIDGVRLADAFAIGDFSNAGRDAVDVDLLKRVEIVRGSASSLYGSDALGGVVSFVTRDPADLLKGDRRLFLSAKGTYTSEDEGTGATTTLAARGGRLSGLIAFTHREADATETAGSDAALTGLRTLPNPRASDSDSLLAKLVLDASPSQRLRVTFDQRRSDTFTEVISARVVSPLTGFETLDLLGDDAQRRRRASLEHEFEIPTAFFDAGRWQLAWQTTEAEQNTTEARISRRSTSAVPQRRERLFDFEQEIVSLELTLHKAATIAALPHTFTWGIEATRTDSEQLRTGRQINLATGAATNVVTPDVFPVRDFPITRTWQIAAYLQDEIGIGRLTLLPGVRVDRYELDPTVDEIFAADNPFTVPVALRETSVSPKLGATWRFSGRWSAFGNYAHAFRAPPYADVNVGFTNLSFGYTALPNPGLDPESGDSFELGVRAHEGAAYFSASVFYSRYRDFIESRVDTGVNPATGLIEFQSQNLTKVRIWGAELLAAWPLERLAPGLTGLTARASVSHARGDDLAGDRPLGSVDPTRAVLGLRYDAPSGIWNVEALATLVDAQDRVASAAQFRAPGYAVIDLLANLRIADFARLGVGVFNVADRKYWEWADVRGRPASDPAIDRYTRPGRAVGVNVKLEW